MARLIVIVEGATEETFVSKVLAPHLSQRRVYPVASMLTTKGGLGRAGKGGGISWDRLQRQLRNWMKQERDPETRFTTMIDFYALPRDFPGYPADASSNAGTKVKQIARIEESIRAELDDFRLIPYIQLHEFEALPLADPALFLSQYPESEDQINQLQSEVKTFKSPEDINLGPETHPSARIAQRLPRFALEKAEVGPIVVEKIGLHKIRSKCPHFSEWLTRLEGLGLQPG